MTVVLLFVLGLALLGPPMVLAKYGPKLGWPLHYALALLPAAYTWGGWNLGIWAYEYFGCQGGTKSLANCTAHGSDMTWFVGYCIFLMIPSIFVAGPLTLWLLLRTGSKHIAERVKARGNT